MSERTLIRQRHAPFMNCAACVAAMLTGNTVEEVHEWLGNPLGAPMHDSELIAWAIKHGWYPYLEFRFGNLLPGDTAEVFATLSGRIKCCRFKLVAEIPDIETAAVAVVSPRCEKFSHMVLWADGMIWDPAEPEPIDKPDGYKILSVIPFAWDDGEWFHESTRRLEMVGKWPEFDYKRLVTLGPKRRELTS